MDSIARFFKKLGMLLRREKFNSELEEEMAFHREQKEKELREAGVAPEAAHQVAAREFGNPTRLKEQSYEVMGFRFETVWQDLHFALRQLRRSMGFTLTAVLMLALGIGASVAIFAFVDAALIKPLPYQGSDAAGGCGEIGERCLPRSNLSYQDYLDWKKMNKVFSALEVVRRIGLSDEYADGRRTGAGRASERGILSSAGRDACAGAGLLRWRRPARRRRYSDPDVPNWQERFGGRKDIIGQTVRLDGAPNTIVGVLPASFQFAPRGKAEFWSTMHTLNNCEKRRSCHNLFGVARLKDGVTVQMALADMTSIAKQLEVQYPGSNRGQGASVMPLSEQIVGDIRPILLVLLGGAGLLLVIACVNVSSLLLVRSEARKREIAVRGCAGGIAVAAGATVHHGGAGAGDRRRCAGTAVRLWGDAGADAAALEGHAVVYAVSARDWFELACGGVCGGDLRCWRAALFALTPMLRLPLASVARGPDGWWEQLGGDVVAAVRSEPGGAGAGGCGGVCWWERGLLGKSFYKLLHVELGFPTGPSGDDAGGAAGDDVCEGSASGCGQQTDSGTDLESSWRAVCGLTSVLPVSGNGNTNWIRFVGKPYNGEHNEVNQREVSSDYFKTLQAKLVAGTVLSPRTRTRRSRWSSSSTRLWRVQYFPGEDPIGRKMGDGDLTPKSHREIVAVVDDVKESSLDVETWPAEYTTC